MLPTFLFLLVESSCYLLSSGCKSSGSSKYNHYHHNCHRSSRNDHWAPGFTYHRLRSHQSSSRGGVPWQCTLFNPFIRRQQQLTVLNSTRRGRRKQGEVAQHDDTTTTKGFLSTTVSSSSQEDGAIVNEKKPNHAAATAAADGDENEIQDDAYFDRLFEALAKHSGTRKVNTNNGNEQEGGGGGVKLVDFIEQTVGIIKSPPRRYYAEDEKRIRGRAKKRRNRDEAHTQSSSPTTSMNQLQIGNNESHQHHQQQQQQMMSTTATIMEEQRPPSVNERRNDPYNVVCTHITADFDTLASAIGLAKLWSLGIYDETDITNDIKRENSIVHGPLPTYVVLPRGAHPDVARFLSLHKHLFPIRSLKSLPGFTDTEMKKSYDNSSSNGGNGSTSNPNEGLQRVGLVDAQRRDRLGPADMLLPYAKLGVTIVDHHVDAESDITEAKHFVVDRVGSVSTMIAERLRNAAVEMTEAEATILALGIHSDTGSLVYDSTTPKDAMMLGWAMEMGASQTAIAEHAIPTLSEEQQTVLTQALNNINRTYHQGVTISTVLLSADGFIPGLATVTKDALDLSSSDIFLLAVCYEATRGDGGGGGGRSKGGRGNSNNYANGDTTKLSKDATERLQQARRKTVQAIASRDAKPTTVTDAPPLLPGAASHMINSESWKGGEVAFQRQRLASTFAFYDADRSGFLSRDEIIQALTASGFLINQANFDLLYKSIDVDSNGKIDFEEFVSFYSDMEKQEQLDSLRSAADSKGKPMVMTIIGRVKAGVNVRHVNLNTLFQKFNGGGHPKAASATAKLENESDAKKVLQGLVDELIDASLEQQLTVGDFMQSPVLSAKPSMTEKQVEDLFMRYDVRALPVVDDDNCVIGLVSYKEVMAAKLRLLNKQEKRLRQMEKDLAEGKAVSESQRSQRESALKGWMKQHVQTVEASQTMSEVENILLEADVGCIPVVADNTKQLIGMVTRTDLLRQHRYYSSLHYHNKGFSDSIAARKPIIELRKKLKKFDIE